MGTYQGPPVQGTQGPKKKKAKAKAKAKFTGIPIYCPDCKAHHYLSDPCGGGTRPKQEQRAKPNQEAPEPDGETILDKLKASLVDTDGLDSIGEPEPLVKDTLYLDSLAWLIGKPGNGKSFVALDIAGCVGTGEVWQGRGGVHPGGVLYLAAEGVHGIRQRVRAWEHAMGHQMTGVSFLPIAVQAGHDGEWGALVGLARELHPALVVVDTQARISVDMEENSARDMGKLVHRLEMLRSATGACVLVVHHVGRAGEHMRGSTAMEGAANTIISVVKEADVLTIENPKQKDAPEFDRFRLRLVEMGPSAILTLMDLGGVDPIKNPAVAKMLTLWWERFESDSVSVAQLVKAEVVTEPTFHRAKKPLVNAGTVEQEGDGRNTRYRLRSKP